MSEQPIGRTSPPWVKRTARVCFAIAMVVAALVLVSWLADRWQLGTLGRQDVPMAPSTALFMLMLAGAGLQNVSARNALRATAAGVLILVLSVFALSWSFNGLESALVRLITVGPATIDAVPIGVMSPVTAVAFMLSSLALLTRHAEQYAVRQVGAVGATLALLLALSVMAGYLLGVPVLYGASVPMAASTGAAFLFCDLGLILGGDPTNWPLFLIGADTRPHARRTRSWAGAAALWAVVTGAVIAATAAYLVTSRRDARREAAETLESAVNLKGRDVARWYRERWGDAETLAASHLISDEVLGFIEHEQDSEARAALLREWMSSFRRSHGYSAIVLYDTSGVVRLTDGTEPLPVAGKALARAVREQTVVLDDFDGSDVAGRRQLSFIAPVLAVSTSEPRVSAVMALVVDARSDLFPMLDSWPSQPTMVETLLVRRDGDHVTYLNALDVPVTGTRGMRRAPISQPKRAVAMALRGTQGPFEGVDYAGVPVLASGHLVPGTPWFIFAKERLADVYAPFRADARSASAFSLLIILTTGFGLAIIARQQTLRSLESMLAVERERQDSVERLRSAIGASLDPFIVLDHRGRVVEWNTPAERTFGWSREEALGQPFTGLTLAAPHDLEYGKALAMGRAGISHPLLGTRVSSRAQRRDGTEFPAELTVMPVRLHSQTAFSAVVRDITDRVRSESEIRAAQAETERLLHEADRARRALLNIVEDQHRAEAALRDSENRLESRVVERTTQLEAANRELEAFSYSVSHDLRAPLRAIDGYARMMVEDYGDHLDAEGQRRLDIVQREARRMGTLIDDLLRFSRVGRQPLNRQPVDMTAMVRDVFAELRGDVFERQVDLELSELPPAVVDAGVIRQVWMNLLGNALKFTVTRQSTRIVISGSVANGETIYAVRDNGVGFDMKYADKLFGVFQRLHSTAEFEGTGVGLALTQRIVSRHGGRIWADSTVDGGATFSFTIPRDAEHRA